MSFSPAEKRIDRVQLGLPRLIQLALVALVAAGCFVGILGAGPVWDDLWIEALVDDQVEEGGLWELATSEFRLKGSLGYYRPVVLLAWWLGDVSGVEHAHHLTSIFLHVAVSLLVWALARRVIGRGALVAALLFATHPIHTNAVAFASSSADLFVALFSLVATISWLEGRDRGRRERLGLASASAVALLLACLSKETGFLLPFVLFGWQLCDTPSRAHRARGIGVFAAGWTMAVIVALALRVGVGVGFGTGEAGAAATDPVLGVRVLGTYLRLLVWPAPLRVVYTSEELLGIGAAVVVSLLFLTLSLAGPLAREKLGLRVLIWTLGFLLPVSGVLGLGGVTAAERYLYLPSVGVALLGGALLTLEIGGVWGRGILRLAALIALVTLAMATLRRQAVWHDDLALFSAMVEEAPSHASGHFNLGNALRQAGDLRGAVASYSNATRLDPQLAQAWNNRCGTRNVLREFELAQVDCEAAITLRPDHANSRYNLGYALAGLGDDEAAGVSFERAVALDPTHFAALFNLAVVRNRQGRLEDARRAALAALERDPGNQKVRALLDRL